MPTPASSCHVEQFCQAPGHSSQLRLLLLLLSRFSRVQLCATSETTAHQAPPCMGFFKQERWSGLPFPSQSHPIPGSCTFTWWTSGDVLGPGDSWSSSGCPELARKISEQTLLCPQLCRSQRSREPKCRGDHQPPLPHTQSPQLLPLRGRKELSLHTRSPSS